MSVAITQRQEYQLSRVKWTTSHKFPPLTEKPSGVNNEDLGQQTLKVQVEMNAYPYPPVGLQIWTLPGEIFTRSKFLDPQRTK